MALRACIDCGLEAHTEEGLELFSKSPRMNYGRKNLCKRCDSKRFLAYRAKKIKTDDRYYLRSKFRDMKSRCFNPNVDCYHRYGGRGITICQEWLDNPDAFIEWALANGFERDLQIDRIGNDGPYSPDNCRWVTPQIQNRNREDNVTDFEKGTRICEKCGVEKSLEEFHRAKSQTAGRMYVCKECRGAINRRS